MLLFGTSWLGPQHDADDVDQKSCDPCPPQNVSHHASRKGNRAQERHDREKKQNSLEASHISSISGSISLDYKLLQGYHLPKKPEMSKHIDPSSPPAVTNRITSCGSPPRWTSDCPVLRAPG